MVTTRRSNESYFDKLGENRGGVALLEREKTPTDYNEFTNIDKKEEINVDEARQKMQQNLQKLLNYDRYSETVEDVAPVQEEVVPEMDVNNEDIRPTSTTMQFGTDDVDTMYNELKENKESNKESYKLNNKGKFLIALYALAVVVVLALIIINTGILSRLDASNVAKEEKLNGMVNEFNQVHSQYVMDTMPETISQKATELGMIK